MRSTFFTFIAILIISKTLFSQDYEKVDSIIRNYPNSFSNPVKLAEKINEDFNLPEEKARAIYTWIALHIEYDMKALSSPPKGTSYSYSSQEEKLQKEQEILENLAKVTIRKRKAVCQGYSTLYKYLSDLVSLECVVITGSSKTRERDIGKIPRGSDHAWNAVKIENEWKLIDATWGAGFINENINQFIPEFISYYFFLDPEKFSLEHFPKDTAWLFTDMSPETFANLPLYYTSYFQKDIEVVSPQSGIIELSDNESFKLILKNGNYNIVSLKFKNDKESEWIKPKKENELFIYEKEYKKSSNTYLTVFVNTKSFMTFKIIKL